MKMHNVVDLHNAFAYASSDKTHLYKVYVDGNVAFRSNSEKSATDFRDECVSRGVRDVFIEITS